MQIYIATRIRIRGNNQQARDDLQNEVAAHASIAAQTSIHSSTNIQHGGRVLCTFKCPEQEI